MMIKKASHLLTFSATETATVLSTIPQISKTTCTIEDNDNKGFEKLNPMFKLICELKNALTKITGKRKTRDKILVTEPYVRSKKTVETLAFAPNQSPTQRVVAANK